MHPDAHRSRQLRHDIYHELGTIVMLASAVAAADDIGAASRARVEQIVGESRWLAQLIRAEFDAAAAGPDRADRRWPDPVERIRMDEIADEVVRAMRLATMATVSCSGVEAWAQTDRLALWRAIRNIVDNAIAAVGGDGRVDVRVSSAGGWSVVQVDDDGPGFGSDPHGASSLGLGIVQDFVAEHGGSLEIRRGELGGSCVRILLPASPPLTFGRH